MTHDRNQEFLYFFTSTHQLHVRPVTSVLARDQDMQWLIQMFPVRFAAVLFLLS